MIDTTFEIRYFQLSRFVGTCLTYNSCIFERYNDPHQLTCYLAFSVAYITDISIIVLRYTPICDSYSVNELLALVGLAVASFEVDVLGNYRTIAQAKGSAIYSLGLLKRAILLIDVADRSYLGLNVYRSCFGCFI
ncbi:hypothetical protein O6H91_08G058400 [Diphasiastrum complanatum]|uniref:Uncharacterized protein n=1 Tax=Diphasiastrum complanatum TaxID=34168 RepID=A0ACC2CXZ6_DIPCM|nr:hypothetical protein O6H91_08G058400 [Diphasiastrum complanatum]